MGWTDEWSWWTDSLSLPLIRAKHTMSQSSYQVFHENLDETFVCSTLTDVESQKQSTLEVKKSFSNMLYAAHTFTFESLMS